jgi:phenylacetate-CoA ligase
MGTNVVGSAILRLSMRSRGSDALRLLRQIRSEPFVSPEGARARQLERLQGLLQHCETQVPFYRQRFTALGLCARDIRTWEDVARLPILTKAEVVNHAEELIAEGVSREALLTHHSGGSTGVPLKFYRDASYITASEAGTYRNLLQCGWRPGEMIAFFWGWNDKLAAMGRTEFLARQLARRMYQFDPFHSGEADLAAWWRTWRLLRPAVALGYASTIARFARYLEQRALHPRPLRGVFTTAEKLFPQQRTLIERVFACRVFDCYGSSEVQNIASECAHGRMHINADFAVVELAEAERQPDGSAPLLVTSLKNLAMPFLRYRNEDSGSLVEGSCDCGNGFPLMSLDVTRVSDNFKLPNGRVVHGEFFTHLMYGSEGIESFQFHQVSADSIVLRYVPAMKGDPTAALAAAVSHIEALAPGQLRVQVESVPAIPLSSAGKHRFTRSEVA